MVSDALHTPLSGIAGRKRPPGVRRIIFEPAGSSPSSMTAPSAPPRAGAGPDPLAVRMNAHIQAIASTQDRSAFAALFSHYAPRVKAYLIRLGCPDGQAEELAQETMLAVWRKADRFDPAKAAAGTWIFTIARNLRIDQVRRERRPELDPDDPALVPAPAPEADLVLQTKQHHVLVHNALQALPPDQARVIALSFFEDKPHGEIAGELGLPLGTVKSRIRLAFARLRAALEQTS
jgi:RNA polymerase sigma-70 factor (ECF subfamily)